MVAKLMSISLVRSMAKLLQTRQSRTVTVIVTLLILTLVAGCGGQTDSPVGVVESYIIGRAASDTNKLISLSCKEQEGQASTDADSFRSMKAAVDGVKCKQVGEDAPYTIVACEGKIITEYAGETRNWNLADRNFKTLQEDGKWKVCGYKAP